MRDLERSLFCLDFKRCYLPNEAHTGVYVAGLYVMT